MALSTAKLPAPLRLKGAAIQPISHRDAAARLSDFLQTDASALLSGSGAVRASIVRLVQGLNDELARQPASPAVQPKDEVKPVVAASQDDGKKKKRRKSDKGLEGQEVKKRRKTHA
ncbi:hypothetical protein JCM10450v2_000660 [Rhodotorula kratochvilovae]